MKKLFVLTSVIIFVISPALFSYADVKTEASPVKIASVWKDISNGEIVTVQGKIVSLLDSADVLIQDRTGLLIIDAEQNQKSANKFKTGDTLQVTGQVVKRGLRLHTFRAKSLSIIPLIQLPDGDLHIFGGVEHVMVNPLGVTYEARMDTGATTCSMNALDIQLFERDSKKWVRFYVIDPKTKDKVKVERPLVRTASIKRHGSEDQKRPVVQMDMSIGKTRRVVEFSLTDRTKYEYPVLIGRNYLIRMALIDVSDRFLGDEQFSEGSLN